MLHILWQDPSWIIDKGLPSVPLILSLLFSHKLPWLTEEIEIWPNHVFPSDQHDAQSLTRGWHLFTIFDAPLAQSLCHLIDDARSDSLYNDQIFRMSELSWVLLETFLSSRVDIGRLWTFFLSFFFPFLKETHPQLLALSWRRFRHSLEMSLGVNLVSLQDSSAAGLMN